MPISVTCQCGARLEIDEKFLGKEIPCPDCQRPLPTQAPAKPPPLELPNHRRKSGVAVLSLTLALVFGWVPVVGPLAAILTGLFGLRQIAKNPTRLEGGNYARAGIVLGAIAFVMSLSMLLSPMFVLYTDQFIRELKTAGKIKYGTEDFYKNEGLDAQIEIKRFEQWAQWTATSGAQNLPNDPIFLVNNRDDAYISCLNLEDMNIPAADEKQKKVLEAVYKSQLVHFLAELRGRPLDREGAVLEKEKKLVDNGKVQEVVVDIRLGRVERRLLIHYPAHKEHSFKVLVGACRRGDFDRMQERFREIFATVRPPL